MNAAALVLSQRLRQHFYREAGLRHLPATPYRIEEFWCLGTGPC
jgi:hypothetical protein